MELLVKVAWGVLVAVHVPPAAVWFKPSLVQGLYGIEPAGDVATLVSHRGALFLAMAGISLFAMFEPHSRRVASLAVGISVVGFLFTYARAGFAEGPLRTIAMVDAVAAVPLVMVLFAAWAPPS